MKRLYYILQFLVLGTIVQAQPKQSETEHHIRQLMADQAEAWNRGSIDDYMKGYWDNDSLLFVGHNGITHGYANTLQDYKRYYPDREKMGRLFFDLLKIEPLSDSCCFVCGRWLLKRTSGDVGGYFTLIFRKFNGEWKIVSDHTS